MKSNADSESKVVRLGVEKLVFDLQNPRFKGLADQREALHSFCKDGYAKKTVKLAEHIAENGLNPSELIIITRSDRRSEHIVLEGNRRLAALKLLTLPARLNDTPLSTLWKSRVRKAAQVADQEDLQRILCLRMENREEANGWISLKHTGENEGEGVVQWDGEEAARFRGRDPGYRLLDFIRKHGDLSEAAVEGAKKFPVTNLERLLGDPDVRRALGITIEGGELLMTHAADGVIKALSKVIEDLATKEVTVTALKRKADRAEYIQRISAHLPKGPPLDEPVDFGGAKKALVRDSSSKTSGKTSTRKTRYNLVRSTVIPPSCNLPIAVTRIKEVFLELRRLAPLESYPNAAAALLRIFIDLSTHEYVTSLGLGDKQNDRGQMELKPRIDLVLKDVTERSREKEACVTARNALLQKHGAIPIDNLHLYVHGRYELPRPENLRMGWEANAHDTKTPPIMTSCYFTPLRYPGGKGKLAEYVKAIVRENNLTGGVYVEPYAGGAAVALELLLLDYADEIHINDRNRSVFAFWHEVLNDAAQLIERIESACVTMDEWRKQKAVQMDTGASLSNLAFSTFFLNRCNRSGILKGGVIGGKHQAGTWKLDARFNKPDLIERIKRIGRFKDRITLHNRDAAEMILDLHKHLPEKTLFYLDPPYYVKGKGLYDSFYLHTDHAHVANVIRGVSKQKWIVSYDDVSQINELYAGSRAFRYRLSYSAQCREQGGEVMFFSDDLTIPDVPRSAPIHAAA